MLGFTQTAIRLRASKLHNRTDLPTEQRDWDNATTLVLRHVSLQPHTSTQKMANDTRQVSTTWRLLSRTGSGDIDVRVGDRIVYGTRTMQVVAEPLRWPKLNGTIDHVEVLLQDDPPNPGTGASTSQAQVGDTVKGVGAGGWRP